MFSGSPVRRPAFSWPWARVFSCPLVSRPRPCRTHYRSALWSSHEGGKREDRGHGPGPDCVAAGPRRGARRDPHPRRGDRAPAPVLRCREGRGQSPHRLAARSSRGCANRGVPRLFVIRRPVRRAVRDIARRGTPPALPSAWRPACRGRARPFERGHRRARGGPAPDSAVGRARAPGERQRPRARALRGADTAARVSVWASRHHEVRPDVSTPAWHVASPPCFRCRRPRRWRWRPGRC
jgi:hypothetical protein